MAPGLIPLMISRYALTDAIISNVRGVKTFKMYYQTPPYNTVTEQPERGDVGSGDYIFFDWIDGTNPSHVGVVLMCLRKRMGKRMSTPSRATVPTKWRFADTRLTAKSSSVTAFCLPSTPKTA